MRQIVVPAGAFDAPDPDAGRGGDGASVAVWHRAAQQRVEQREGLLELERTLGHAAGDVPAGKRRRDGSKLPVPQARALAAHVVAQPGRACGGADRAEPLGVLGRQDAHVGESLLQRDDELQLPPGRRVLVAHRAQLGAGVPDVACGQCELARGHAYVPKRKRCPVRRSLRRCARSFSAA